MIDLELSETSMALAATRSRTENGVVTEKKVVEELGSVTVGKRMNRKLVSLLSPGSAETGRYQRLRHGVEKLHQGGKAVVVAVTSPMPGEGKSVTAINLAASLSQNRARRVLLIELDLRHPFTTVNQHLDVSPDKAGEKGVSDWIGDDRLRWTDCVFYIPECNLHVFSAGVKVQSPYEVLDSPRLAILFGELRDQFDYIVVDTPPVNPVPDCQLIEPHVDRFVVVVAAGRTTNKQLEECLGMMQPEQVAGLVLNGVDDQGDDSHGYY